MKKYMIFLILLLTIGFVNAQENWFYNSETLEINLKIGSEAIIEPTASDYNVDYVNVNITFVPEDDINQKILKFETEPTGIIENNAINFEFNKPSKRKLIFNYDADIRTYNRIIGVKEKIKFPLLEIPNKYEIYLQSRNIIDSDDKDIIELASKLVEGENDLYVVVHKLASWTKNNIKYNLSTLTAEVSQKASWVLENKLGVCDELTSLFIAMLRAVGIPAKFISGISFTNSPLFPEQWGAHGWAEVYFPGVGFVPFDVTYGEFGYVDPTHIKLRESVDSDEASTQYKWLARNVDLNTKSLDIDASLISFEGEIDEQISVKTNILKPEVDFGSYNIIEAQLENLKDYYVSSEIFLSRTKELEVFDNYNKQVLLKPKEKKSVYWLLKVTNNLEKNFIYTFPVIVSTLRNFSGEVTFKASEKNIYYSLGEMEEFLNQKEDEETKVYSRNVNIDCSIDKNEFYEYESAVITCKVKNIGNVYLKDLDVCYKYCKEVDLGIGREEIVDFLVQENSGKKDIIVKVSNGEVSKTKNVEFIILDDPSINIINIKKPTEVMFEDLFVVNFELNKTSNSNPLDLNIDFKQNGFTKTWNLKELVDNREFIFKLDGKSMKAGSNLFEVLVSYKDGNGKLHQSNANFNINLVDVTFFQKIEIAFLQLNRSLENMTVTTVVILMTAIGVIFVFVIMYVFRKRR